MTLPDFLTEWPYGEIMLQGHRIGLYHVVYYYNEGYSAEMLACQFPTLPLALIHKVIAFYLENKVEVDAYVSKVKKEIDHQAATLPRGPDMNELRRRLDAMQRSQTS